MPDGRKLATFLDHSGVERLWQANVHVNWLTGQPDPARPGTAPHATHCSAFAAAMATRLGVPCCTRRNIRSACWPMPRRVGCRRGKADGWRQVTPDAAQRLANRGWLVVASFANPDLRRPGHIAVLRPSLQSTIRLRMNGPAEAQAGFRNRLRTWVARGFASHPGAWQADGTGAIRFYAHKVNWDGITAP